MPTDMKESMPGTLENAALLVAAFVSIGLGLLPWLMTVLPCP